MLTLKFDTTTVAVDSVDPDSADSARCREHAAVMRALRAVIPGCPEPDHRSDGAPFLPGMEHVFISISHCRTHAAAALDSSRPIGIDIELPRTQLSRIAPRFLAAEELDAQRPVDGLLALWTAKEAAYKAFCLAFPGHSRPVDFRRDIRILSPLAHQAIVFPHSQAPVTFSLSHFQSPSGFHICLATPSNL